MAGGETLVIGLIAAGAVPWIVWTMLRGLREGRLPIARSYVAREERPAAFFALLALYAVAAGLVAYVAVDQLTGQVRAS